MDPRAGTHEKTQLILPLMSPTTQQPHSERSHSRISPSGLGSVAVCPHFINDDARPEHPSTREGTQIHEAIEVRNIKRLPMELRPIAQIGIDYWDALRRENPAWSEEVEPKVKITAEMAGHLDLIRFNATDADQVDYKSGVNEQATAATNIQQKAYAVGLFKRMLTLQRVRVHIVYVRLLEADVETFSRSQLPQLELEVLAVLRRAQSAQNGEIQVHNPDPSVCVYCKLAGVCPALNKIAQPIADAYAKARPGTLTVPAAYDPAAITQPAVMSKALVVADIMERWAESVRRHAVDLRLTSGQEIPGYSLIHREGTKSVVDADLAYSTAAQAGLVHAEIMQSVTMSIPKLMDALRAKTPKGKKKQAAEALEDAMRDAGALMVGQESYHLRKIKNQETPALANERVQP